MGKLSNEQMLCGAVILVLVYLIFRGKTTEGMPKPRSPRGPFIRQSGWNRKYRRPEYRYIRSGRKTSAWRFNRDQDRVRREQAQWDKYVSWKGSSQIPVGARKAVKKVSRIMSPNKSMQARLDKAGRDAKKYQALSDKQGKAKGR